MYRALPGSDYYEGSAPPAAISRRRACPPTRGRGGRQRTVPTFTADRLAGSAPSFSPDSLATSTPQAFLVASRPARLTDHRSRLPRVGSVRALPARPTSARLEPRTGLEGVPPLVHCALRLSASLAEPGPSGGADPSRRCRGCSRPHPRLRDQAAPNFKRSAATNRRWALSSHPTKQRLVAHRRLPVDAGGLHHHLLYAMRGQPNRAAPKARGPSWRTRPGAARGPRRRAPARTRSPWPCAHQARRRARRSPPSQPPRAEDRTVVREGL
jgi:hypothetical protein